MSLHDNTAGSGEAGGAEISQHDEVFMPRTPAEIKQKIEIAELVGALAFIVDNLDDAAREASIAADAITAKNISAGYYHVARFAAHARAACGAFRDLLDEGRAA